MKTVVSLDVRFAELHNTEHQITYDHDLKLSQMEEKFLNQPLLASQALGSMLPFVSNLWKAWYKTDMD